MHSVTPNADGYTGLLAFSLSAELIPPHRVVAGVGAWSDTVPLEYAGKCPQFSWRPMTPDPDWNGPWRRSVDDSQTLQQINLVDAYYSREDFNGGATATWSVLPGATAQARLWCWHDNGTALGQWQKIAPGADITAYFQGPWAAYNGTQTDYVFAEMLTEGRVTLRFTYRIGGFEAHDDLVVFGGPPASRLAIDANGDGRIDVAGGTDAIPGTQPYPFIVNDAYSPDAVQPNWADAVVNGADDLPNFKPVCLDLGALLPTFPPGNGVKYLLRQEDDAINFVYTRLTQVSASTYMSASQITGFGPAFDQPAASASVQQVTAAGVELPAAFLGRITPARPGVILIEARKTSSQPLVLQIVKNGVVVDTITLHVQPTLATLVLDANRDGEIKLASEDDSDATSADKPFRFWLNDDNDQSKIYTWGNAVIPNLTPPGFISPGLVPLPAFYEREQDDQPVLGESDKNCDDLGINGTRDLEDFARLWIDVSSLRNMITGSNPTLQIGLKWTVSEGSPAIRLFRAAEATGGTGYLFSSTMAEQQIDQTGEGYGMALGSGMIDASSTYVIPQIALANLSESQPSIRLLFEGCRAGRGQLKLVILKLDGTEIGEGPGVWMDLREPNEFVERFSCGDGHLGEVLPVDRHASSATFTAPTTDEEKDYVLYVHGYNMADFEKQRWIETAFKRLYWLGYKGRVGGFTWPCSQSVPTFDASEEKAWLSAAQLRIHLENLKAPKNGYRVHVIAHSQGNVVMGEALRLWKASGQSTALVSTYLASQAAIAAHCYNADAPLMPDYEHDTPNVYACYWRAGDSARFPQTWPTTNPPYLATSIMQTTAGRWVNFYNPQDFALTAANGGVGSWENDQRLKPDNFYNWSVTNGFFKGWVPFETAYSFPDHRYAIFSYCAEARSVALGTIPTAGAFGAGGVNMESAFGYGREHLWHSGQFRSSMASRYQYWAELLRMVGIQPYTP